MLNGPAIGDVLLSVYPTEWPNLCSMIPMQSASFVEIGR